MTGHLPSIPPVQQLGDAVLFRGTAVRDLARLLPTAVRDAARRDGIAPPARWREIIAAVDAAARMSVCPASDVRSEPHSSSSLVSVVVAADLLGISERQVRRLGHRIGGRKIRGDWLFDREGVEQEAQRRRKGTAA